MYSLHEYLEPRMYEHKQYAYEWPFLKLHKCLCEMGYTQQHFTSLSQVSEERERGTWQKANVCVSLASYRMALLHVRGS